MRAAKIRCGFGVAAFGFDRARDYFAFAEQCEAGGVDSLWQTDRLVGADAQLEPMAAMASLAGATERIKFGVNAVVVAYRDPLVLAKECATIDFLSNGRLLPVFGVGFGPDRIIPLTAAPAESNQMISPKHFREFSLPYQKEVYEKLLVMGVKHINTHICGEQNMNLPYWAELPLGNARIISVGHEVDLEEASTIFPNHILVGNVEPAVIQTGTPEQVYERCRSCIEKGKKHPGGFALAPGCELPPMAPPYNVWMLRKAINDFGWYE